ncbi:MAG: hypothetical protein RLZZ297_1396 [Chloroflexota bacterium]|jgi:hypothetical protein
MGMAAIVSAITYYWYTTAVATPFTRYHKSIT